MKSNLSIAGAVIAAFVVLASIFGAVYTIDEGERGVVVTMGTIRGTAEPNTHLKLPFITAVYTVPTRNLVTAYANLEAYTSDQQIATVEGINVTYRIPADRVEDVYRDYRTPEAVVDRFIGRRINAVLETVFGRFTAETSIRERGRLGQEVATALRDIPADAPIEILTVELTSLAYPPEYNARINERMGAEVEVARLSQEVLQANQRRLAAEHNANAAAYAVTAAATAEAEAIRLRGEAEASAIRAKSDAMAANPAYAEFLRAERWDGVLPTSMIPGTAVPFLNVSPMN